MEILGLPYRSDDLLLISLNQGQQDASENLNNAGMVCVFPRLRGRLLHISLNFFMISILPPSLSQKLDPAKGNKDKFVFWSPSIMNVKTKEINNIAFSSNQEIA